MPTFLEQAIEISIEMTGDNAANPITAFEQWKQEREAMREIFDQNEALKVLNRRLIITLQLAQKAIEQTQADASMFITDKTRKTWEQFQSQLAATKNAIIQSKELNHG